MDIFGIALVHLQRDLSVHEGGGALLALLHDAGEQHLLITVVVEDLQDHAGVRFVRFKAHVQPREHPAFREIGHHDVRDAAELEHLVAVALVKDLIKRAVLRHGGIHGYERALRLHVLCDRDGGVCGLHRAEEPRIETVELYAQLVPMLVGGEHVGVKVGVSEAFDAVSLRGEQRGGKPHGVVSTGAEDGESRGQRASADGGIILNGQNSLIHTSSVTLVHAVFKTESKKVNHPKPVFCRKKCKASLKP